MAFACFGLFRYRADPINNAVGQEASIADREALRERLGINDSIVEQYAGFVGNAVRGDFGISYHLQRPVAATVAKRLPATMELVFASALLALFIGIALGVYDGLNRDGALAWLLMTVSLIGVSLPTFVIAIGLTDTFAVNLPWLPFFRRGQTVDLGWRTTGFFDNLRSQGAHSAVDHALALPADPRDAPGGRRDARGAARRRHQRR